MLCGQVTLTAGAESWEDRDGDLLLIPDAPHSLTAQADSAVLLTAVKQLLREEQGMLACLTRGKHGMLAWHRSRTPVPPTGFEPVSPP